MYVLFILVAVAVGAGLIFRGSRRQGARTTRAGVAVLVATALFFGLMSFWAEMLWFRYAGYADRFWTAAIASVGTALVAAAVSGLSVFLLTRSLPRPMRSAGNWAALAAVVLGAIWGFASWEVLLQYANRVGTGVVEPIFGRDTGFYLFTLPFLERAHSLLFGVTLLAALAAAVAATSLPEVGSRWASRGLRRMRVGPGGMEPIPPFGPTPPTEPEPPEGPVPPVPPVPSPGPIHPTPPGEPPPIEPLPGPKPIPHVADGGVMPVTPAPPESTAVPRGDEEDGDRPAEGAGLLARPVFLTLGLLSLSLALGRWLAAYNLLYSRSGIVSGPGWTDVHVRLPAYQVVGALLGVVGLGFLVASASKHLSTRLARSRAVFRTSLLAPTGLVASFWIVGVVLVPLLFQWLYVTPNEITVEKQYLAHNITFTRRGFDLDKVEEHAFAPSGAITAEVVEANQHLLSEVRLWDPKALQAVLEQFQELRLYYEMADIDVDRYVLGDRYRQVLVTAREMEQANLPEQSQTFVNRHFKYTHGHGVALASAHDFTPDGLPNLLVEDIPPVSHHPELHIDRPEIYYGQRTRDYVVANTTEPELDYPSGENNVYNHYSGVGGVPLSSFWRKLVYGWELGGTRLLVSGYPTDESRVLYRRNIRERVATLAPFLDFDRDPYITVVGGRLRWIIDGYTTSRHYPYSDPYFSRERLEAARSDTDADADADTDADADDEGEGERGKTWPLTGRVAGYLHGANYVRNSVKAVVDAYDGTVTFYVFEPEDPIVQVWSRIYPGLFRAKAEMPPELFAHVRYPEGFLLAQGLVHARYHMTDPEVFYNQEDLWVRATERYYDRVRPVDPYYVMWKPPGAEGAELALIQPFTPRNRQVLIGWLAGLSDGDNYGRLIAYRFPKDQWVLGTQQVDTKIDQDRFLSAQLSLWDQRGSRVIRGNVLVIPIAGTLLYVEPIYLQAEAAAYPELRVVVLMHGDRMSYADTFEQALRGLVTGQPPAPRAPAGFEALTGTSEAARRANESLGSYLRLQGERRFEDAAAQLRALERALNELQTPPGEPHPEGARP